MNCGGGLAGGAPEVVLVGAAHDEFLPAAAEQVPIGTGGVVGEVLVDSVRHIPGSGVSRKSPAARRRTPGCFDILQQHLAPDGTRYPWLAWVTMKQELADAPEQQLGTRPSRL
jgi:hypothetical protein